MATTDPGSRPSGIRRDSKLGSTPGARGGSDSKVRRASPAAPAEEPVASEPAPSPSKIRKPASTVGTGAPGSSDSKVRRAAAGATGESGSKVQKGGAAGTSESKIRKAGTSDSKIRRGEGGARPDWVPLADRPDPYFKLKKGILLSIPVLIVLLAVMMWFASQKQKEIEEAKSKGPVTIVGKDFGAEIKKADGLYDEAFEYRKQAMMTYADDPVKRKEAIENAIRCATAAKQIYQEAKKELGGESKGFEYIDDNMKMIDDQLPKFQEVLNPPQEEKPSDTKTTNPPDDGKSDPTKKDGAAGEAPKDGGAPKDDGAKKEEGK